MTHVVTISATFGAGGSVVGPSLAERLGVPFVDRAIPTAVAREIGCSLQEVLEHDDRAPTGFQRLLASAARLPAITPGSVDMTYIPAADGEGRLLFDHEFVDRTEQVIRKVAESGGVILGRAGAAVLADTPRAVHVRLDGPPERRLRQATVLRESTGREPAHGQGGDGDDREAGHAQLWSPPTMRDLRDNDRARAAYVRRFYQRDPASAALYHLVLDSTVIDLATCADIIERVVRERAAQE
ncbi:AAA family ATPase [Streptomonospora nanhaiensis]|uniref:cytidylate kinase-like family protein n=1 Tax=Streptomonospora nanhaiensis TaxID=1323731 RepID=UPI0015CE2C0E|nr:cytidylate kinase-like family protein [Streptomonospora nanhaiensis]MBV2366660.1 cytidylate kinase-like family protein [Streptomonospora nanhaiensis]MBX9389218.1 cytidylate kinase-like family protein [Streptomonospora nanhaiensis]